MMMDEEKRPNRRERKRGYPKPLPLPKKPQRRKLRRPKLKSATKKEETPAAEVSTPEATQEEATDETPEEEEVTQPTAKVIQRESTKVNVVITEEVKEEGVEIDEADTSGTTGEGHADFNWNMTNRSAASRYSDEERQKLEAAFDSSMTNISEAEIMSAKVSHIIDGDVILDLNYKSRRPPPPQRIPRPS